MPYIRERHHLSYSVASLHFSAFAAGGVLAGLSSDRVARRAGRHRVLWGGVFGMVIGYVVIALSPSALGTICGALATGWFGTLALVANQSSLSDLHPVHRTVAIAESNVAASSAAVIAPLAVGAGAAIGAGWQAAVLLGAPAFAILAAVFYAQPLPDSAEQRKEPGTSQDALPRTFWIFWAVLFMVASVEWCVAYWGADYLHTEIGLRKAAAATAMSVFFAAMVAGRAAGARLARRHSGMRLLQAALSLALVGFPVFWLAPFAWLSLSGLFIAGVGIANFYPLTIAVGTATAPGRADRAAARLAISGSGALLTVPLLVGSVSDLVGMRWGFGLVLPLLLCSSVAVAAGQRSADHAGRIPKAGPPVTPDRRATDNPRPSP